jgi:hypothetical protein
LRCSKTTNRVISANAPEPETAVQPIKPYEPEEDQDSIQATCSDTQSHSSDEGASGAAGAVAGFNGRAAILVHLIHRLAAKHMILLFQQRYLIQRMVYCFQTEAMVESSVWRFHLQLRSGWTIESDYSQQEMHETREKTPLEQWNRHRRRHIRKGKTVCETRFEGFGTWEKN